MDEVGRLVLVRNVDSSVNVFQENVAENPKFCKLLEVIYLEAEYQRPSYNP